MQLVHSINKLVSLSTLYVEMVRRSFFAFALWTVHKTRARERHVEHQICRPRLPSPLSLPTPGLSRSPTDTRHLLIDCFRSSLCVCVWAANVENTTQRRLSANWLVSIYSVETDSKIMYLYSMKIISRFYNSFAIWLTDQQNVLKKWNIKSTWHCTQQLIGWNWTSMYWSNDATRRAIAWASACQKLQACSLLPTRGSPWVVNNEGSYAQFDRFIWIVASHFHS